MTPYREVEKSFKPYKDGRRNGSIQGGVLDFACPEASDQMVSVPVSQDAPDWLQSAKMFAICGMDGFRFIRCPFSPLEQLDLARSALCDWTEPPNVSNLELHYGSCRGLWDEHRRDPQNALLARLSWLTLGYHYQWTERRYDLAKHSSFPRDLATLASELASACSFTLYPEAAIVNFYGPRSTMGGHRDDAEPCQKAPIVSISIGLSAIFLLGGETKDVAPLALLVRSGDVIVQGGSSRGYYHGIPRIIADSAPDLMRDVENVELGEVASWLRNHRINANVRQVFDKPTALADTHRIETQATRVSSSAGCSPNQGSSERPASDHPSTKRFKS
eukprot:CAMPEP_0119335598 /NCGR_PEP_ID=MMETSP1333-20130426/89913_1 /TAXON_ID=418940 /ORGANISM="Scyphosphaera apsteinii, Strain RCC1455" /LENGTH=331 /DNA_ID=CAMNT_0007346187 /DNA_START=24 /DNA_END=1019 /DNA_ORIENTATION=+